MARRIVVQPQSDLDIQAAAVWYEDQQSGLGTRFLDELDLVFQRIAESPGHWGQICFSGSPIQTQNRKINLSPLIL